ncbi:MAG TPA: hypothetical protein VFO42_00985 [Sphingomicrobium sp.]|nr:hypothetical protein [Sphingomicrobium sp.]
MIHFLPDYETAATAPHSAAASRAGGLARALAVVEELAGEAPGVTQSQLAARLALADAGGLLDQLSERAVAASAAGLEAIAVLAEAGGNANPAAARLLADTIRDALDEMGAQLSL